jgi:hypothetical protein
MRRTALCGSRRFENVALVVVDHVVGWGGNGTEVGEAPE